MKISVPTPCHENWNQMLPEEQGRFCLKCAKTVVDFSAKTKEEVHSFFRETAEKVCGRFKSSQLEKPKTPFLPTFLHATRTQKFAFALYLVFGSLLFSCSGNNNQNQTVGKIVKTKNDAIKKCGSTDSNNISELGEVSVASYTLFKNKKHTEEKQFLTGKVIKKPEIYQEMIQGDVIMEPEIHPVTTGIPMIEEKK